MRKYIVQVEGHAADYFDTLDEAMRYAVSQVYLIPERVSDMRELVEAGKIAEWSYGFAAVMVLQSVRS